MKKLILGSVMMSFIVVGAVVMMIAMYSANLEENNPAVHEAIEEAIRNWGPLADADPGSGNCGVVNIFIYPHQAVPQTAYGTNITEGNSYAYGHINNTLTGYVPYATTFDIVVKYRYNSTVAKCSTNATWMISWVNSSMYSVNQGITPTTTMGKVNITASINQYYVHFYMNNGGAGYTITHGQIVNITAYIPYGYW